MTAPSPDAFAALARSSPWLWSTLRFTVHWGTNPWKRQPLRAWLRRPDLLRVETTDGALLQVVREHRALPPAPALRPDGWVAERRNPWTEDLDAPMYQDYRWVAMLDPRELADGVDHETGEGLGAVIVEDLTEVEHGGRPAWQAVLRTTDAYEPRCGCCPLLRSAAVDALEYAGTDRDPTWAPIEYADAHLVRLDVGTGVCVYTAEIGGPDPGYGHDLRIEAVDEPMPEALFPRAGWYGVPQ